MKQIDVKLLKNMFISASNNLYNHYPDVDALNVFPVPDGDTGTNMNLTLASGTIEIENRNDENVYDLAKAFSKGLLMGARGNSGVITSQIFRGFAEALKNSKTIDLNTLVKAFVFAKEYAYKAVVKPVEGTILTVVRESSTALNDKVESFEENINEAFKHLVREAKSSLKRTPELLPVLKEVGVVDSGGAGYVLILEGMFFALNGKIIEKHTITANSEKKTEVTGNIEANEFGYCTELIIKLDDGSNQSKKFFNKKRFISTLSTRGNSMVVVQDEDIVKVHIHTLTPGWVLNYAQQFGEFKKLKIENMTEQHNELMLIEEEKNKTEDAPIEPLKDYAMIAISCGDGISDMFKEIGVSEIVSGGQTMNPSTEDILEAINRVHAKNVFILPNNSNIVMAASQACELADEEINAKVIPTSSIPQGIVASMNFDPDANPLENFNCMKGSLKTVKSGSVTYAIKDTKINDVKVQKDQYMAISNKKIITCVADKFESLRALLKKMISKDAAILTIFTGEDITDEEFDELEKELSEKYTEIDIDLRKGNQPVYSFIVGVE